MTTPEASTIPYNDEYNSYEKNITVYKINGTVYQHAGIRMSLFEIVCISACLPALIWATRWLRQLRGTGGRASAFMVSLLLSDTLEVLLCPYFLTCFLSDTYPPSSTCTPVWGAIRLCGFCFHQLVALEGILTLRPPLCLSQVDLYLSSQVLSIVISLIVWIFGVILVFNMESMSFVFPFACVCIVVVALCVLACKAYRAIAYTGMNPALYVTAVALFTLIFLYGPYMFLYITCNGFVIEHDLCFHVSTMCLCIMSLRLIADPLLSLLVCKVLPIES